MPEVDAKGIISLNASLAQLKLNKISKIGAKIGATKWAFGYQNQLNLTLVEILIFKKWDLKWELKRESQITSILKEFGILVLGVKWGYRIPLFPNSNSDCADPNNGLEFF